MTKICVFGGSGQLGRSLVRDLAVLGDVTAPTRQQLDLTNIAQLQQWLQQHEFDLLVNAAAMTQVDVAQTAVELTWQLNHQLPAILAAHAKAKNIWLVHFSTDYVFDGSGDMPWRETDDCQPLQQYGISKRAGELAIQTSGCLHLLIRTSWLYDSDGQNFLLTMLQLARAYQASLAIEQQFQQPATAMIKVVADQIGAPTFAPVLSAQVTQILSQLLVMPLLAASTLSGTYHLCAAGHCSWFQFSEAIFQKAFDKGILSNQPALRAVSSLEFARPAPRPKNSRLDTRKVQTTFALELTHWQQQLEQCLELLKFSAKTGK
ncbi:MAG: dTDP-4-dehydrorhamnose reductase [Gammaproteobacteria bacterium]|nr:dTDP-4-dehydrorhamnose reductase [Gammaproteobacteria bacterium]